MLLSNLAVSNWSVPQDCLTRVPHESFLKQVPPNGCLKRVEDARISSTDRQCSQTGLPAACATTAKAPLPRLQFWQSRRRACFWAVLQSPKQNRVVPSTAKAKGFATRRHDVDGVVPSQRGGTGPHLRLGCCILILCIRRMFGLQQHQVW